ncbi:type II toxin-antitoxin system RnlB family antitoxin [Clostridium algidicarnis]|uniref:type II toxin-antitoxin system RnlB family antitoxin n=1 Tax=Clostridium algidicarnis TaxID=37659 RepID=UPI001C0DC65A|nr:type II toxin-antitoxin system RnlB family antitoxin [Clostridium algidicarnis]MBU3196727.1 type II toxin-antitoxin system RnlB family antitoxin [Clostridium algidicarnis]
MKRYEISILNEEKKCMIFSTTYASPLDFIKDIENDLKSIVNYSIEVVFDFLLSSGNSKERFGKINYTGSGFDMKSFQFINVPKKNDLRKVSVSYYKNKDENLDNSILTSMQKKMIKKGIAI